MFWKKSKVNSDEYEFLLKRISELKAEVAELSSKVAAVTSDAANLRGQFNRKVSGIKKEESKEETQSINNPVILPYNGIF